MNFVSAEINELNIAQGRVNLPTNIFSSMPRGNCDADLWVAKMYRDSLKQFDKLVADEQMKLFGGL